jgi:lysophospholipid acyltransferase (LPLAT)-like uncharacterized protein
MDFINAARMKHRFLTAADDRTRPLAFACSGKQLFSRWDHFMVPNPFSRGLFPYGKSIFVSREDDDDLALETELNRLTEEVERAVVE